MQQRIINVVSMDSGLIEQIKSFVCPMVDMTTVDCDNLSVMQIAEKYTKLQDLVEIETVNEANEYFKDKIRSLVEKEFEDEENTEELIEEYTENGYYEYGDKEFHIIWSE